METDQITLQAVMAELEWDQSIDATNIAAKVKDGIVTLAGKVPSFAQKHQVEKIVMKLDGVAAVVDELQVSLPMAHERNDAEIAKAAVGALAWNANVPGDIKVKVEDGWVTLEGEVQYQFQRNAAFAAVKCLWGVRGIVNHIKLTKTMKTNKDVRKEISAALHRRATVDASSIIIENDNGEVKISGKVRTLDELNDVKLAAWCAPGVKSVECLLRVGS